MRISSFLFSLLLCLLSFVSVSSGALNDAGSEQWQKRIAIQCYKNMSPKLIAQVKAKAASRKNICMCVGKNFVTLSDDSKTDQEAMLGYVEKYYGLKLSRAEIERDPFYIDEFFIAIGSNCLRNPEYIHSYEDGSK